MFPISHVYILNKLVNRGCGRNLERQDAKQIMGVWLLDALVTKDMRKQYPQSQKYFHSLPYSTDDPLQAGIKIHVLCDNLANCGQLEYKSRSKDGFLSKREKKLFIPAEQYVKDKANFRRRMLQSGLDMVIVRDCKEELKQYFQYAARWVKRSDAENDIFLTFLDLIEKNPEPGIDDYFLNEVLDNACEKGLMSAVKSYSDGAEYLMSDWRRARVARSAAGEEYSKYESVKDLIIGNFHVLDGWEKDIDRVCGTILTKCPDALNTFKP